MSTLREKNPSNNLPIIIKDSREQQGYNFKASKNCGGMVVAKLDYGDYSLEGMLDLICVERKKSIDELCGNIGKHRERFEREFERMQKCLLKYVIIEDHWKNIWSKKRFSKIHPNSVFGSIISLSVKYDVNFIMAGSKEMGHKITRSLLLKAAHYRKKGEI